MTGTIVGIDRPVQALPIPWQMWLAAAVSLFLVYLLQSENGAVLSQHWSLLHEVVHDGRHVLGVPCH
jgi:hypothetical protein